MIVQVSGTQAPGHGYGAEESVQEMAGLKLQQGDLMRGRTGWRPESEENEVSLR